MVVNRGDIKRKRKDDSCFTLLDESPKRTKVHAQRKFAQGSNVSSPVITPVKEIERQERNKDVLPEPIELLPMKRPNTEDFLTFLCFRGTPILPPNLNFFNTASMMESQLKTNEPKTTYPKNGPILTTSATISQNEKPFVAFGVRKRADPIVISKQMDRKRRHALALQALRRKYQEQKMAKIRAVTISKLSEKVSNKNIVRTRSVTKNETALKKSVTHKTDIKVVSTKHITTKTALKQPIKSRMCLRSFRGRYIHRELNIKAQRKRQKIPTGTTKVPPVKKVEDKKSSSEFSSDDDEPLMKAVKTRASKKVSLDSTKKQKKATERGIRVTRSNNKLLNVQSQRKQTLKHRRIITRLSSTITPSTSRIKNKIVQTSNIIRNMRRSVNTMTRKHNQKVTQVLRSTRQRIIKNKMEKTLTSSVTQTRSRTDKLMQKEPVCKKEEVLKNDKEQKVEEVVKKNTSDKSEKKPSPIIKGKVIKKNDKSKIDLKTKIVKKSIVTREAAKNAIQSDDNLTSKKIDKQPNVPSEKIEKSTSPLSSKNEKPKIMEQKQNLNVRTKEQGEPVKRKVDTKKTNEKVSRPSRKTKEAAAIYMELLGHKLVNDNEVDDDDESIDSFPELPNVRKTEQRENELKAKAKSKTIDQKDAITGKNSKDTIEKEVKKEKDEKKNLDVTQITSTNNDKLKDEDSKKTDKAVIESNDEKKQSLEERDSIKIKDVEEKQNLKKSPVNLTSSVQILTVKEEECYGDKDKDECKIYKELNPNTDAETPLKRQTSLTEHDIDKAMAAMLQNNNFTTYHDSETESLKKSSNDNGNSSYAKTKKSVANNPKSDSVKPSSKQNFCDSDEEPLSNLTKSKDKPEESGENQDVEIKTDKEHSERTKRESIKKKTHNYLPFSSSDDDEKYFHGFVKTELKSLKISKIDNIEKCPQHSLPSSDLSCKDVSRRYGKGKVNMSNEQIEKWLNDSAMAGMNIKKEEDEILKYEEEKMSSPDDLSIQHQQMDIPIKLTANSSTTPDIKIEKDFKAIVRENEESSSLNSSTPEKLLENRPIATPKYTPTERKTIFKKEKSEPVRNVNAFSASNECSVYAFEADNEDSTSISTPFRRPCRRPSSTATSRSEDDSKMDDISKNSGKFRFPTALRNDFKLTCKQDTSPALQDDSNNTSILQTNLDSHAFTDTSNSEPPSITEDVEQLFYTSVQSNKNISPEGVAKSFLGKTGNPQRPSPKLKATTRSTLLNQKSNKSMFPPSSALQKGKNDNKLSQKPGLTGCKSSEKHLEPFEDAKYKIPSSPSASSSSSAKLASKRQTMKTRTRASDICTPINVTEFPSTLGVAQIVEAPSFHPSEKEFQDPLEYIEKIRNKAEKFGICRIIPPANFKPECKVSDDMRFTAYNQYVHKMLHRWGPNFKELIAIRKYLETQNITLTHPPWIGGMEIDLPRLYQTVQSLGGLKEVIEKKKWPKVSEAMKIPKSAQDRVTKLDDIYCKYLLPYDTLSPAEREKLFDEVETEWAKRESKTLLKAQRLNKVDSSSGTDADSDSDNESEECIVKGRNIALNAFYRIARNTMSMWFKTTEPPADEVEQEFWKHVTLKANHICVHSGSIDSGNWGYGFAVSKNSPFARHAWNLKVLTNNSGSVLRSMGPVMGVTVPTLHVGMVFSACCWYRDPHRLPWIEYLHTGAHKIWYGIPDSMSERFHSSMLKLVPNYCRNKSIWLPSDTVMVPPKLLVENGVSLCRTVQEPGQFVVVFPKVFTSSVSTGYVVSESVYFAPSYWLQSARNVFDELRNNSEPSMFSIDRLLLSITSDTRSSIDVLKHISSAIRELCDRERTLREKLRELGLKLSEKLPPPEVPAIRKRRKLQQQENNGDYECEICRTNLFISLVNEYQEDVVYCLEHVIEYVEQKKVDIKNCKLLFTYECEELDSLLDKVKNTIEAKQQKKVLGKIGVSSVK